MAEENEKKNARGRAQTKESLEAKLIVLEQTFGEPVVVSLMVKKGQAFLRQCMTKTAFEESDADDSEPDVKPITPDLGINTVRYIG